MKPFIFFDGEKWCVTLSGYQMTRGMRPGMTTRDALALAHTRARVMNEQRAMQYFTGR